MKELSLNILDITENSVKAGATLTEIFLTEGEGKLTIAIRDNGSGMSPEVLRSVSDPFYTTRTTRRVGLGIPLLTLAAEQTGGGVTITSHQRSEEDPTSGTEVCATFFTSHIDCPPLGDIVSTVVTLIQGHPDRDFLFRHTKVGGCIELDTRELRAVLEDVPLSSFEVLEWIRQNLTEQYQSI